MRDVMGTEEAEEQDQEKETHARGFTARGEEWLARVRGRTRTGGASDAGAPLCQVRFARAAEPDQELKESFVPGHDIDHLYDEELASLLDRARTVKAPAGAAEEPSAPRKNGARRR